MLLLDGDIVAYRVGFTTEETSEKNALNTVDNFLYDLITTCNVAYNAEYDYTLYLTGAGNFRHDIATSYPYKGNRGKKAKPKHFTAIRQHMIDGWDAVLVEGEEADDAIAIAATNNPEAVIVSVDKDFLQVPTRHYNMTTGETQVVNELEGTQFFYKQILTGDRVDNIIGIKGVGPKKADAIIGPLTYEIEMYKACVEAYESKDMTEERVIENARLLWLRRKENELWEPPYEKNS